jgi:glycosyltransferase involved in cell wall biosynthesis
VVEENGRRPVAPPAPAADAGEPRTTRDRFGYFGQFTAFKGSDVLMEAMQLLTERRRPRPTLRLHGANIEHQPEEFQAKFRRLLDAAAGDVTLVGRYRPDELPALMRAVDWVVVPSIWWENAPLVIQEAFALGRPVICSDIGGMAEKVTDGVDGLHFRAGDPAGLADVMERAVRTDGLWDRLRAGIGEVHSLQRHVARLGDLYDELLTEGKVHAG